MDVRNVTQEVEEIKELEQLYYSSFPEEERVPFSVLLLDADEKEQDFISFFVRGIFVGFAYLVKHKSMVLLLFLAVKPELRSQGIGSAILQEIYGRYSEGTILLDIESVYEEVDDLAERKVRKNFYLRNGFSSAGIGFHLLGTDYEVLFRGNKITGDMCQEIYDETGFCIDKFVPLRYL